MPSRTAGPAENNVCQDRRLPQHIVKLLRCQTATSALPPPPCNRSSTVREMQGKKQIVDKLKSVLPGVSRREQQSCSTSSQPARPQISAAARPDFSTARPPHPPTILLMHIKCRLFLKLKTIFQTFKSKYVSAQ